MILARGSFCLLLAIGVMGQATAQTGDIPRTSWGTPDLNGVWQGPYVADMSRSNGRNQFGPGELPFTEAGRRNFDNYDARDGDYTGACLPFGLTRSMNAPSPVQFLHTETHLGFLYEQNTWFQVVNLDGEDRYNGMDAWFGHSTAQWEDDTLVVTTSHFNGRTRLDTIGHPHSDQLVVTQRFALRDESTMDYEITIDDPVYYREPWSNQRVFTRQEGELIEYSCNENNRSLWEGGIRPPDYLLEGQ